MYEYRALLCMRLDIEGLGCVIFRIFDDFNHLSISLPGFELDVV